LNIDHPINVLYYYFFDYHFNMEKEAGKTMKAIVLAKDLSIKI
jgi:hypothetical protein